MNIAFYTGVSGLTTYQEALNVTANNIANVNTDGYKPAVSAFKDLLYNNMDTNGEKKHILGHGVKTTGSNLIFKQGNLRQTESQLDYAIVGNGMFAADYNGETYYTRNGMFEISVEKRGNYLVSSDGGYILDGDGRRIEIPYEEGADPDENPAAGIDFSQLNDMIGIYAVSNPYGLLPADGTRFMTTDVSGEAVALTGKEREAIDLLSSTLESSKVDLADEMVAAMKYQKSYQFSAKMVQTADEIEEIVNNLR